MTRIKSKIEEDIERLIERIDKLEKATYCSDDVKVVARKEMKKIDKELKEIDKESKKTDEKIRRILRAM